MWDRKNHSGFSGPHSDLEPASPEEHFMGSKVSAVLFILTSLITTASAIFAFETEDKDYRQKVISPLYQ